MEEKVTISFEITEEEYHSFGNQYGYSGVLQEFLHNCIRDALSDSRVFHERFLASVKGEKNPKIKIFQKAVSKVLEDEAIWDLVRAEAYGMLFEDVDDDTFDDWVDNCHDESLMADLHRWVENDCGDDIPMEEEDDWYLIKR